jgi:hypothetical protein
MSTLSTTRSYDDGEVLVRADLDACLDDIETFFNVTKINDDNIQNSGITGSTKLLNQSVTAAKLASDSVTTLKIADLAVTTAKINDLAVTTAKINDLAVTTAKIADLNVTTGKLALEAVTTATIDDDAVTADKLRDDASVDANRAVTTDHIRDSAITTAKINAGAVTPAKLAVNYVTATLTRSNTTITLPSHDYSLAGAITTFGRPIRIRLYAGTVSAQGVVATAVVNMVRYDTAGMTYTTLTDSGLGLVLSSGATVAITYTQAGNGIGTKIDFEFIDFPAAGAYQYGFDLIRNTGTNHASVSGLKMIIEEL